VNANYRLGLRIVLGTISLAAVTSLLIGPPAQDRMVHDLSNAGITLSDFELNERSGRQVGSADLAGQPWIAGFIFTRCKATCPRITSAMKALQDRLAGTNVRLVSISVDPEHDTPQVLADYARTFSADPERWWFLTGTPEQTRALVREGFKLALEPVPADDPQFPLMDISHSNKLALVGEGNQVLGMFNAEDPAELAELLEKAQRLQRTWVSGLPAVNASLNSLATVLLLASWIAIRRGRRQAHIAGMIAALVVSAAFLACYLVYHAMIGGGTKFLGTGAIRTLYFTILISHVILAAAVVPLILVTVVRAARGRYAAHVSIARVTYPIWLYVSITGVLVYLMLYQMPVAGPGSLVGPGVVAAGTTEPGT
jgi:protein SCO1/2/putative membrane protein